MCVICGNKDCRGKIKYPYIRIPALVLTVIWMIWGVVTLIDVYCGPNSASGKARAAKIAAMKGESEEVYKSHRSIIREEVMMACIQHYSSQYSASRDLDIIQEACDKKIPKAGTFETANNEFCQCSNECKGFNNYLFLTHDDKTCTAYYIK